MRTFLQAHWKATVAILLLVLLVLPVLLAMNAVTPAAAAPGIPLAARLRSHVAAIASNDHDTAYIANALKTAGYAVSRQARNVEVSVSNVAPNARPSRIFIVGANGSGNGAAAVLELARLLKDLRPSRGTELKFVFFANGAAPRSLQPGRAGGYPETGNFIAFVGTMASARVVQDALSAFRAVSGPPARGLAAPAYVQGVTLSDHPAYRRDGYPAVMITDTAFLRYPYYEMQKKDGAGDTQEDGLDYDTTARVVQGLARTLTALAAGAQG